MFYTDPFIVHHDSEDSNNKNISTGGQVVNNSYIQRDVNGISLQFWIGYGWNNDGVSQGYINEVPNLGFSYGVFGTETQFPAITNGNLYVDDENSQNANTLTKGGVTYTQINGDGVTRASSAADTKYNFMKVR